MIRSIFTFAFRNFRKSAFMNGLNVLGLTMGLSVFFLIALFLYKEMSYERDFARKNDLYQLGTHFYTMGDLAWTSSNLAHVLDQVPAVERFTQFQNRANSRVFANDQEFKEIRTILADSSFFEVFNFDFISGNPGTVLDKRDQVVIKAEVAERFFGTTDVVGKTIYLNKEKPLTIMGVSRQPHFKTQLDFDIVVTEPASAGIASNLWGSVGTYTYVLKNPESQLEDLNTQLDGISEKYIYPIFAEDNAPFMPFAEWRASSEYLGFFAESLASLRTDSTTKNLLTPQLDKQQFNTLIIIALAALLIAVINFINISTAKATSRLGEVALKRILGSGRAWLIAQFMLESFVLVLVSALMALAIVELLVQLSPGFLEGLLGYSVTHSAEWMLGLVGFVLLLTLVSGIYPALYLSSAKALGFLRGGASAKGFGLFNAAAFRKGATVFQFVLSISLITGVITMFNQLDHLRDRDLGYEAANVFVIDNCYALGKSTKAFKDAVLQQASVSSAAYADHLPNQTQITILDRQIEDKNGVGQPFTAYRTDPSFFEVMNMDFVEGAVFPKPGKKKAAKATDEKVFYPVVINEAGAKALGLESPIGEVIDYNHRIVGVVSDFLFSDLRQGISPVIVGQKTNRPYYKLAVKMQAGNFDIAAIQEVWQQFTDKEMKWYELSDNYAALMKEENKSFSAVLTFSVLTIIISCLGLFGLVVFSVDQRYKEFGIRKVLGATVQQIARLFGWDFVKLVLIAFIVAVPVSLYALDLWLNDFADRITLGAGVFAVTALITMAIVMATIAVQSIKAGQLNPIDTLRSE